MLLPIHIVLLELIIDPTCSIVLERQPAEKDIMDRKPRNPKDNILSRNTPCEEHYSGIYYLSRHHLEPTLMMDPNSAGNAPAARGMGLAVIMLANLFLVQVNSSNTDFAIVSARNLFKDRVIWIVNIGTVAGLLAILYTPVAGFLKLAPLEPAQLMLAVGIAAASVLWYEFVKLFAKIKSSAI